jgi:hypothetical protein
MVAKARWFASGDRLSSANRWHSTRFFRYRRAMSYCILLPWRQSTVGIGEISGQFRIACLWRVLAVYLPKLRPELPRGQSGHAPLSVRGRPAARRDLGGGVLGGRRLRLKGHNVSRQGFFLVRTQRTPLGVGAAPSARAVARSGRVSAPFAYGGSGVYRQQGHRR